MLLSDRRRIRQRPRGRTVSLHQVQEIARPRDRHNPANPIVRRRDNPDRLGALGTAGENKLLGLNILKLTQGRHGPHVNFGQGNPVNPIRVAGLEKLRGGVAANGALAAHAPMIARHVGLEQHGGDAQLQRAQGAVFPFDIETGLHI